MAERLIGSIRRECLDHAIVFNEEHLCRTLTDYLSYHHRHRTPRSLEQDCPELRAVEPPGQGKIIELPLVRGLHHRYARQAAAAGICSLTAMPSSARGLTRFWNRSGSSRCAYRRTAPT